MTAIVALLFVAGIPVWAPALSEIRDRPEFLVLFVVFTTVSAWVPLLLHTFVARQRGELSVLTSVVEAVTKIAGGALLIAAGGVLGIFAGWGVAFTASVVPGALLLVPRMERRPFWRRARPRVRIMQSLARYSLANFIADLAWFTPMTGLIGWILPLVVVGSLGARENAFFYVVWSMVALINGSPVALSTSLLVEGVTQKDTVTRNLRRAIGASLILVVPIAIVLGAFAGQILQIFGRTYAAEGADLLRLLVLSAVPLALNAAALGVWKVQQDIRRIAAVGVIGAAITIGVTVGMSGPWGILAPGAGWLMAQSLIALTLSRPVWLPLVSGITLRPLPSRIRAAAPRDD